MHDLLPKTNPTSPACSPTLNLIPWRFRTRRHLTRGAAATFSRALGRCMAHACANQGGLEAHALAGWETNVAAEKSEEHARTMFLQFWFGEQARAMFLQF